MIILMEKVTLWLLDTFLSIALVKLVIISKPLRYAAMILSQKSDYAAMLLS